MSYVKQIEPVCRDILSDILLRNNSISLESIQKQRLVTYVATVKDAIITKEITKDSSLILEEKEGIVRQVQPLGTASEIEIREIVDTMVTEILERDIKI